MISLRLTFDPTVHFAYQLYDHSEKIEIPIILGDKQLDFRAAIVGKQDLVQMLPGAEYAMFYSGMYFMTKEVPEQYRQIIAFHERTEFELLCHRTSTTYELAYAEAVLGDEYSTYLDWRRSIEDGLCEDKPERSLDDLFDSLISR